MNRRGPAAAALLAAAAAALALRLPLLGNRPFHADEAVHAVKFAQFLSGEYRYDAGEFHGPALYLLALPFVPLAGGADAAAEGAYRVGPALAGAALALLPFLLLGNLAAALGAALLAALSPALVYYSRDFIPESPFVLAGALLAAAVWRYLERPGAGRALLAGAAAGLMAATKETAVLTLAALAAAALTPGCRPARASGRRRLGHLAGAAGAALVVAALLLASFGRDPGALGRVAQALPAYLHRGTGGGGVHDHPWDYYLGLLLWSRPGPGPIWTEGAILLLALAGAGAAWLRPAGGPGRFLTVYTLVLAVLYSALPYKTPWCLLGFLQGATLLAGIGTAALLGAAGGSLGRGALLCLLLAAAGHLGVQAVRAAFAHPADPTKNPYVYAQTGPDALRLAARVEALARLHPDGRKMRIDVIAPEGDYWPLPWYFRRHDRERIGWWTEPPPRLEAPVTVAAAALAPEVAARLGPGYHESVFGLRPAVLLSLFVAEGLWRRWLEAGPEGGPRRAEGAMLHRFHHRAMGSPFEVRVAGGEEAPARQAAEAAFALLDRLEGELSRFRPESALARLATLPGGTALPATPALFACLEESARLWIETEGAFDPTVGALMECWRGREGMEPPAAALAAARAATGFDLVRLHPARLEVVPQAAGIRLDLGGIGKGFAVDQMCALLAEWGHENALVHGGHSSVRARGAGPGGKEWEVALPDPGGGAALGSLRLAGRALGASGRTTRGDHILDPRTGRPATAVLAAWVLAPTAAAADGLATAAVVLGPEGTARLCRRRPDVAAMLLMPEGMVPHCRIFGNWPAGGPQTGENR